MVYGTNTIPKVQKIIGPGNKWVNAAKQLVSTEIAIDNPAGPSEVLIIADENADFNLVLLDLISQIEHDPDNIGIIISNSSELLTKCENNLEPLISKSKRKTIISSALQSSLLIQAKDLEDCIRISNLIAPEHLEILIDNPHEILPKIKNAGAIFLGPYSPVPLGDYSAGTNHILPTGGTAKTYSGLNIYDFLRIINVLECNKEGLKNLSQSAATLAEFEGLIAHKNSIIERLKDKYQKS
jgi:histidinol dehydrogenase